MAKRLIWSPIAREIRKEILEYWILRNKSSAYSKKLNKLFNDGVQQILKFPDSGISVFNLNYRAKLIENYYLIYFIKENQIEILFIWDTRQDPDELLKLIQSFI